MKEKPLLESTLSTKKEHGAWEFHQSIGMHNRVHHRGGKRDKFIKQVGYPARPMTQHFPDGHVNSIVNTPDNLDPVGFEHFQVSDMIAGKDHGAKGHAMRVVDPAGSFQILREFGIGRIATVDMRIPVGSDVLKRGGRPYLLNIL